MLRYGVIQGLLLSGLLVAMPSLAEPLSNMDACLLQMLRQSGSDLSVGQIKAECEASVQKKTDTQEATEQGSGQAHESTDPVESPESVEPAKVVDESLASTSKAETARSTEPDDSVQAVAESPVTDETSETAEPVESPDSAAVVEVIDKSFESAAAQAAAPVEPIGSAQTDDPQAADSILIESVAPADMDAPEVPSLISQRIQAEKATRFNPFVLSPHKRNYVLLASYNKTPNYEIYNLPASDFDRVEMKFQLSFKIPVYERMFGSDADLYVAYTNLSFWQAYNRHISSPFRETVHEPEMMVVMPNDWSVFGWKNSIVQFGLVHQSNGQGGYLSRSWNRFYGNFIFEKDNYLLSFRPWARISESEDDNPDITDYLGHYELTGIYKHGNQTFSMMLRNLLENSGRETLMLDWSFPLYQRWRGYVQYFNGYGENLIDYNAKSNRIGFGLQLTDWL
jgi:phospholipase A1